MESMAKKKPSKRKGKPLYVWIDSALRKSLEDVRRQNRRKLRDEVSIALEAYLRTQGAWPPVANGSAP